MNKQAKPLPTQGEDWEPKRDPGSEIVAELIALALFVIFAGVFGVFG